MRFIASNSRKKLQSLRFIASKSVQNASLFFNHINLPLAKVVLVLFGKKSSRFIASKRKFFLGWGCRPSSKMSNIFGCTCPNHSGVGAIDNPEWFEQTCDKYYLTEVSEKNSRTAFRWAILRKCTLFVF